MNSRIRILGFILMAQMPSAFADVGAILDSYGVNAPSENQVEFKFNFKNDSIKPTVRWMPSKQLLLMDFQNTDCLTYQPETYPGVNILQKFYFVKTPNLCRWIGSVNNYLNHSVDVEENFVLLSIEAETPEKNQIISTITDFTYHADEHGAGQLKINYCNPGTEVSVSETENTIAIRLHNTKLSTVRENMFNVSVLNTPVQTIQMQQDGEDVIVQLSIVGLVQHALYQMDDALYLEISKREMKADDARKYTGDEISLNFQNIETRAVLQLLADFTNFNVVTSDTVQGNVTLRLKHVPWDQALDLILTIKGLDKREEGNVLLIAPADELAEQEISEMSAHQALESVIPLETELMTVNYAKAEELANLLKKKDTSILSARGRVSVDVRTNTLLLVETKEKLNDIRELIKILDKPVKQVLIEARIVKANDDFEKALGVKMGATARTRRGGTSQFGFAGNLEGASAQALGQNPEDISLANRLAVNLPRALSLQSGAGSLGITLARLPGDTILDLELQALESEGIAELISTPRLITANQKTAYIESGEEIPYNETTSSGAASIAFKKAVLRLEVTPQITPDNHIILDLLVNQDSRGTETAGVVAIDKQEMKTQALVADGETIVLGGIFKQTRKHEVVRVPFFSSIPYIGSLFRNTRKLDQREELLIFVTPRVVTDERIAEHYKGARQLRSLEQFKADLASGEDKGD